MSPNDLYSWVSDDLMLILTTNLAYKIGIMNDSILINMIVLLFLLIVLELFCNCCVYLISN